MDGNESPPAKHQRGNLQDGVRMSGGIHPGLVLRAYSVSPESIHFNPTNWVERMKYRNRSFKNVESTLQQHGSQPYTQLGLELRIVHRCN